MASRFAAIVVCDAGPIIHLDELGCLDLFTLFGDIVVPDAVGQEVERHRPAALRRRGVPLRPAHEPPKLPPGPAKLIAGFSLDRGEQHALRCMASLSNAVLLTDDNAARKAAKALGYEVHGTLGMLLLGLDAGRRTKRRVLSLWRNLRTKSSLHVTPSLLAVVTDQVRGRP